jgi:dihydroorotate dehydrogenase (NAD+) catalytic subunit
LESPVTVASGTFGKEYLDLWDQDCLGAFVTKTITPQPKAGNPPPRLWETEAGLLNSIGLENPGLDVFVKRDLPELREKLRVPLIVSFSGSCMDDFCAILERLETQSGIAGYEVNVSCPNVEREGMAFGVDADVVYRLTRSLADITSRELIIKLSPNVSDIASIAKAAEMGGATSIALINTLLGMAIDWRTGISRIKKGIAGYSGTAIKPVALAMTCKAASNVQIPILAMGGINTFKDALEFFYAGASAVAVGTGSFYDPLCVPKLVCELREYLNNSNASVNDIIGKVTY